MIIFNEQITNDINLSCKMKKDNEYWIIFTEQGGYISFNIQIENYKERVRKESYVRIEMWHDKGYKSTYSPKLYQVVQSDFKDYSNYSGYDSAFITYIETYLNNDNFREFVEILFNAVEEHCKELF